MSEIKSKFYKTLNNIVATNRIDNEEAYIINNYVSELEYIIKEAREYGENCINNLLSNEQVENPYKFSSHLALEIHKNYLEILDKGEENNGTKVL